MALRSIGHVPDTFLEDRHCKEIASLEGIIDLVLLPDVHIKQKYVNAGYQCVVPSSSVTASGKDYLYPQIRSRGIGCGMALWPLGIEYDQEDQERLSVFAAEIYRTLLYRRPVAVRFDDISSRLAPFLPNIVPPGKYGMRRSEYLKALAGGAERYLSGLESAAGERVSEWFEEGGNHLGPVERDWLARGNDYLSPRLRGMRDFSGGDFRAGLWLEGNHYIEMQVITEVYDQELLAIAGISLNEVVIMNHSCGYGLEWALSPEIVERRIKIPDFQAIPGHDPDYKAIRVAVALLKNLGSMRRAIFYKRSLDAVRKHLPEASVRLLAECNHNDIEWSGDQIKYRHNALRLRDDRFQIVSGLANHPSYLIRKGDAADKTYCTVGHGLGVYLKELQYTEDPDRSVTRLGIEKPTGLRSLAKRRAQKTKQIPYYKGDPGDEVMQGLQDAGVIKLVAKLSPCLSVSHQW